MWNRKKPTKYTQFTKYTQIVNDFCCRMWTAHAIGYGWILQKFVIFKTFLQDFRYLVIFLTI